MPYDPDLAAILRADLAQEAVTERRMFGGLVFLSQGNMVCGVGSGGGMFRIPKAARGAALAVPGAEEIRMGARIMGGMVGLPPGAMADPARRGALLSLALAHVRTLPPK